MNLTACIAKTEFLHPGEAINLEKLARYIQRRPGVIKSTRGSPWVDHGLGSRWQDIVQTCASLQSRKVLGRHIIHAPNPKLLAHLPPEQRAEFVRRTAEASMDRWYGANGWGKAEYVLALHDKEKNDKLGTAMNQMHAHILMPGTCLPDPELRRMPHIVRRPHIYDLNRTVNEVCIEEFERVLGRDRARTILLNLEREQGEERREAWLKKYGGIPKQNRDRAKLDMGKLGEIRSVIALMHAQKHAKEQKNQQKKNAQAIRQFARRQQSLERTAQMQARQSERARQIEAAKTRRRMRDAASEEDLAKLRAEQAERLTRARAKRIPWIDIDRGYGIER